LEVRWNLFMLYLYLFIYPKCPPFIFSFHKKYSMTTIGCFYFSLCIHLVHSTFFYITLCEFIIEHLYIEYLISLHNLSCTLLLLWRMNHLAVCSNNFITSFITCALQYYMIKIMMVACHFKNYFVLSFTYSRTSRN